MVDPYPDFFRTAQHVLLSISSGSDLLARSIPRSKGHKQN
jgi:hypothetical protein